MEMQVQEAAEKILGSPDKSRLSDCVRGERQIHKHRSRSEDRPLQLPGNKTPASEGGRYECEDRIIADTLVS